jgi:glucan 1,3-beta-glucosidase
MRFSTYIIPGVLAMAPNVVDAAGKLGFALGAKQPNGACKVAADYEADFDAIAGNTGSKIVRIYAAGQCNSAQEILPAAKTKGFQVVLGIWPNTEDSYQVDKAAVLAHAPAYTDQVYAITIGSETLYQKALTADQLVAKINDMRSAAPQFRYGTADTWNRFQDGTADPVVRVSDIVLVNAFAYWQGQLISNATATLVDDIDQAYARINSVLAGKPAELWVGETGWPTGGTNYQNAQPGVENAKTFYADGVCGRVKAGDNVFVFEAFDEPWKPVSQGLDGSVADETHWGVMGADRAAKYGLKC